MPIGDPAVPKCVIFIQGGGDDVHDQWDNALADSLGRELGAGYEVVYPRMPDEADPRYDAWVSALADAMRGLGDGVICVGHSIGGTILLHALAAGALPVRPAAVVVIAPPFTGEGGWPGDGLPDCDLARDPPDVPVRLFYGSADEDVPPAHAGLYARSVPQIAVTELAGRDHQLNNDLSEVAEAIRGLG